MRVEEEIREQIEAMIDRLHVLAEEADARSDDDPPSDAYGMIGSAWLCGALESLMWVVEAVSASDGTPIENLDVLEFKVQVQKWSDGRHPDA